MGTKTKFQTWNRDAEVWAFGHVELLLTSPGFETRLKTVLKLFHPGSHGAVLVIRAYVQIKTKFVASGVEFTTDFPEILRILGTPLDVTADALDLK